MNTHTESGMPIVSADTLLQFSMSSLKEATSETADSQSSSVELLQRLQKENKMMAFSMASTSDAFSHSLCSSLDLDLNKACQLKAGILLALLQMYRLLETQELLYKKG